MKTPSIALALVASFTVALLIGVGTMPPAAFIEKATAGQDAEIAQYRHHERDRTEPGRYDDRRQPVDCHRAVRTHSINGMMVAHRHVGGNTTLRRGACPAAPPARR